MEDLVLWLKIAFLPQHTIPKTIPKNTPFQPYTFLNLRLDIISSKSFFKVKI